MKEATKPTRGRPRLQNDKKKNHTVTAAFNESEFQTIEKKAEAVGITISEFVAQSSLKATVTSVLSSEERQLLNSLKMTWVNINQISKTLNGFAKSGSYIKNEKLEKILDSSLEELMNILDKYKKIC